MRDYTVPRTGKPPLRLEGEVTVLADADGHLVTGRDQTRWHRIIVYRTASGACVVRIAYRTQWQGELDYHAAEVCSDHEAVRRFLEGYNLVDKVRGYPNGDHYREKQARLLEDLRSRYEALVTEVYEQLGEEFAETLP